MWPVGLVGGMKFESPVVEGGKVGSTLTVNSESQVSKVDNIA